MNTHHLNRKVIVICVMVLLFTGSLTGATEKDMVQFQGIVMTVDLKKHSMVVNERLCVWNPQTPINDEKGLPIDMDRLKAKTWVYVEGVQEKGHRRVLAKAIYLLPKYVDEKEKRLYPFIK
jgi:hypothetical protein